MFSTVLHTIMLKTVGSLKTSKLSFRKLGQVPRDYAASFGHEGAVYSCGWNTGPPGLLMLERSHLGEDVSCKQQPQWAKIRRFEKGHLENEI